MDGLRPGLESDLQSLAHLMQEGHYQETLGVTQRLQAGVLHVSWLCGFLGSGKACWE